MNANVYTLRKQECLMERYFSICGYGRFKVLVSLSNNNLNTTIEMIVYHAVENQLKAIKQSLHSSMIESAFEIRVIDQVLKSFENNTDSLPEIITLTNESIEPRSSDYAIHTHRVENWAMFIECANAIAPLIGIEKNPKQFHVAASIIKISNLFGLQNTDVQFAIAKQYDGSTLTQEVIFNTIGKAIDKVIKELQIELDKSMEGNPSYETSSQFIQKRARLKAFSSNNKNYAYSGPTEKHVIGNDLVAVKIAGKALEAVTYADLFLCIQELLEREHLVFENDNYQLI